MRWIMLAIFWAMAVSSPALAQEDSPAAPPPVFDAVLACEKITDTQARLACFDRTVSALSAAFRERELAVFDRSTMREARRGIFGLSLPRLKLFGGDDDAEEEVQSIDSTLTAVSSTRDGKSVFGLADGSRWRQTELRKVFANVGQPIHIKRGALGGYMAKIGNRDGIRVIRIIE